MTDDLIKRLRELISKATPGDLTTAHRHAAMIEGARLMQEAARCAVRTCQGVDAVGWLYADGAMSQLDPATVIKEAE